jgi:hypothetical protein
MVGDMGATFQPESPATQLPFVDGKAAVATQEHSAAKALRVAEIHLRFKIVRIWRLPVLC